MEIINREFLNQLSRKASKNERLRINHNFHQSPDAPSQRLLNAMEPGTRIPVHKHDHTAETYVLLSGSIRVDFYNAENEVSESAVLDPKQGTYGINIPAGQIHSLEVLEHGTVIFECKDGPYVAIK
ncbi:MAG: WbuC family cupin fold metalloprotein [Lentimicrobiaceae bacterium]